MKFPTGFTYRNLHGFTRFTGYSTALVNRVNDDYDNHLGDIMNSEITTVLQQACNNAKHKQFPSTDHPEQFVRYDSKPNHELQVTKKVLTEIT